MKNQELIAKAAVQAGILSASEAKRVIEAEEDAEPLEVKLWKRQEGGRFYLAKAYLYSKEQVVKEK